MFVLEPNDDAVKVCPNVDTRKGGFKEGVEGFVSALFAEVS